MSQHDFNIANQGFPAFRADLNNALGALATNSAGTTEPDTTFAYQYWYDETTNILKMRNAADDAWIDIATVNQSTDEITSFSGLVIGTDVQAFDADILKADTADTITAPMRGTVTSVSSSSNVTTYDMNTTNNFSTTTTETTDITFSNETAGQSGNILFVNAGHVVSIDADVHMADGDLNAINVAGTYFLSYFCPDGTNVYLSATPAQTEGA